jgi:class 3 adenylate cyclase
VEAAGGRIDKFIGDGVMALFARCASQQELRADVADGVRLGHSAMSAQCPVCPGCQHGKLLEPAAEENSTKNHECACLQQ